MKQNSHQLNESMMTLISQDITSSFQNKLIQCPFNHLSTQLCLNIKCTNNAFICDIKGCSCQISHKTCNTLNAQRFIKNINQKAISTQFLENFIDDKIQQIIDSLSEFLQKTKQLIRHQYKYLGLNKNQKLLLQSISTKNFSNTTSKIIWQILHNQEISISINKLINQNLQKLNNHFSSLTESINIQLKNIKQQIQSLSNTNFTNTNILINNFIKSNIKSYILTTQNQAKIIQGFFIPKTIKSAKLVYRASQNDFSTKKFHQKSNGILNTLLLMETQFNKKIGGYTPIEWSSPSTSTYVKDDSKTSFIFSLSNGDKFQLIDNKKAVQHNQRYGPIFGQNNDLVVTNQSNVNDSWMKINYSYKNEKYQQNDQKSYESLCGNQDSHTFKIKQWEVWSLQFL